MRAVCLRCGAAMDRFYAGWKCPKCGGRDPA